VTSISVKNLTVKFGDFVAVNDVSFDAPSGSFITLLGPSGCGKTTLLKMIAGFLVPLQGSIALGEKDVTDLRPEVRDTAMCFQSYALFPHLTVEENVGFGPKQKKLSLQERTTRVDDAIAQVDLVAHREKLPNALSGGQQQRVALARALAMGSGVILFDEPLSNLDAKLRDSVRDEIRALQKERGFTAIYVTHDQAEALAMSDKIIVMNKGEIAQIGAPEDIYNQPKTAFVADFVGTANIMTAKIASVNDTSAQIETDLGTLTANFPSHPVGHQFSVSWRPESMILHASPDALNAMELTVIDRVFVGNLTSLIVAPTHNLDVKVRIETLGTFPVENGATFYGSLPSAALVGLEDDV